jgi:hypothetical protein
MVQTPAEYCRNLIIGPRVHASPMNPNGLQKYIFYYNYQIYDLEYEQAL